MHCDKIVVSVKKEADVMKQEFQIGDGVQWDDNGLRFGWLKKLGYKWAVVEHPVWGKMKVKAEEIFKYEKHG